MKMHYVIVLLFMALCCYSAENKPSAESTQERGSLSIGAFPFQGSSEPFVRGTPMRVLVALKNTSNVDICLLVGDMKNSFSCKCTMVDGRNLDPILLDEIGEKPRSLQLSPGQTKMVSVFLNNYYDFKHDGEALVSWRAKILYLSTERKADGTEDDQVKSVEAEATFTATLIDGSEEKKIEALEQAMHTFQTAKDRDVKGDAIAAIASVRSHLALPYLERFLYVSGYEGGAALVIGNRWADDKMGKEILEKFILTSNTPHAIDIALTCYATKRQILPNSVIQRLLQSKNPEVYSCGVRYVQTTIEALRLDLVNKDNVKDPERAKLNQPMVEQLETILKNIPIPPKEKTTGNGF
jgi:hypothetical protein